MDTKVPPPPKDAPSTRVAPVDDLHVVREHILLVEEVPVIDAPGRAHHWVEEEEEEKRAASAKIHVFFSGLLLISHARIV